MLLFVYFFSKFQWKSEYLVELILMLCSFTEFLFIFSLHIGFFFFSIYILAILLDLEVIFSCNTKLFP